LPSSVTAGTPRPDPQPGFYVSPDGNDAWSGKRPEADEARTDGPFATIQRARDAVRQLKAGGEVRAPLTVCLRKGIYFLDEPLVLAPEDSGAKDCPVTYAAYPGEQVTISGGRRITGWTEKDGLWTAQVPEAKEGKWFFRELFVNGERRFRPRLPKEGYFRIKGLAGIDPKVNYRTPMNRFEYAPGDIDPRWTRQTDIEVVVLHYWVDTHLPVAAIDDSNRIVTFTRKSRRKLTDDYEAKGALYYVDNVFEALREPGQWYLDRKAGVVHYRAKPGEDMTRAEVIAPRLVSLIRLEGKPEQGRYVEHVVFRGLTFSHTAWELPANDAGDAQSAQGVPGAIWASGARDCAIDGCAIRNIGTYGIEIADGCTGIRVAGNEISDTGAGGIKLGGGDAASPAARRTGSCVLSDNHIHHVGQVYHSGAGILIRHSAGNTVSHNEIDHTYYTAISVGWVWGYGPSVSRDNIVEFNHIHDIGQKVLSDMGGVYTLGVSPGTVIRNNVIHDVDSRGYGGWGIYTDEGSTGILIENNVTYRTKSGGFHQHYGKENVVRNNVFAFAREGQIIRSRKELHLSFTFERNIVYWNEGPLLGKTWSDDKFQLDYNLYWNSAGKPVQFDGKPLENWQKRGQDVHSMIADPLFVDPAGDDFRLKDGSPAPRLGFRPIDVGPVGPRKGK
jgi:hypothetical protein